LSMITCVNDKWSRLLCQC